MPISGPYDFLAGLEPAFLHIFPFSDVRNSGFDLPGKVQPSVATARVAELEGSLRPPARRFLRPGRRNGGYGALRKYAPRRHDVRIYGQLPAGESPYDCEGPAPSAA